MGVLPKYSHAQESHDSSLFKIKFKILFFPKRCLTHSVYNLYFALSCLWLPSSISELQPGSSAQPPLDTRGTPLASISFPNNALSQTISLFKHIFHPPHLYVLLLRKHSLAQQLKQDMFPTISGPIIILIFTNSILFLWLLYICFFILLCNVHFLHPQLDYKLLFLSPPTPPLPGSLKHKI